MTTLQAIIAVAGVAITLLVVVGMVLLTPSGTVPAPRADTSAREADLSPVGVGTDG